MLKNRTSPNKLYLSVASNWSYSKVIPVLEWFASCRIITKHSAADAYELEAEQLKENVPQFNVGDTVKVYGKIKEGNRERIQVFEGTVLKKQGGSSRATFTVRKNSNGVGVEKTWPLHSPNVEKVEVVRRGKVRRAKLNYLRGRIGKAAKVKELVK